MNNELQERYMNQAYQMLMDICKGRSCHECWCNGKCCDPDFKDAIARNDEEYFNDLLDKLCDAYDYHLGVNIKAEFVTIRPDEVLSLFGD